MTSSDLPLVICPSLYLFYASNGRDNRNVAEECLECVTFARTGVTPVVFAAGSSVERKHRRRLACARMFVSTSETLVRRHRTTLFKRRPATASHGLASISLIEIVKRELPRGVDRSRRSKGLTCTLQKGKCVSHAVDFDISCRVYFVITSVGRSRDALVYRGTPSLQHMTIRTEPLMN